MIAFTYVYNEQDILPWTLKAMLRQGVRLHVIDNWSTDSTRMVLCEVCPVGTVLERWPHEAPPKWFDLDSILHRIEAIHAEHEPEWALLFGADEVMVSCWPDVPLNVALERVRSEGYNAVNFRSFSFHPVDNDWTPDKDPEAHFQYYTPGRRDNIRAWFSDGKPITILDGTHDLQFEGIRVYPLNFAIKHYSFRTQAQAERKVFEERRPRYHPANRAKGWHGHYDHIQPGYSFIKDPRGLRHYDPATFFDELQERPA